MISNLPSKESKCQGISFDSLSCVIHEGANWGAEKDRSSTIYGKRWWRKIPEWEGGWSQTLRGCKRGILKEEGEGKPWHRGFKSERIKGIRKETTESSLAHIRLLWDVQPFHPQHVFSQLLICLSIYPIDIAECILGPPGDSTVWAAMG